MLSWYIGSSHSFLAFLFPSVLKYLWYLHGEECFLFYVLVFSLISFRSAFCISNSFGIKPIPSSISLIFSFTISFFCIFDSYNFLIFLQFVLLESVSTVSREVYCREVLLFSVPWFSVYMSFYRLYLNDSIAQQIKSINCTSTQYNIPSKVL